MKRSGFLQGLLFLRRFNMKVIDLTDENKNLYFVCLEDWSEEIKEAGNHKELWFDRMKDKGLGVKLVLDDSGQVGGMIQYIPVELSPAEGKDLYFINCIWVHGHKKGRGNFQKKGMGKALLKAAEEDAQTKGAKGMVAWGVALPFWMKASWFRKRGYKKVDKQGMQVLLWKQFDENAAPPGWIKEKKKPETIPGKVTATAFLNGWCPAMNLVFERAKRAASEIGDTVVFQEMDTFDRETFLEWGISDALFIDGKQVRTGPPPSYEKIKKKIVKRVQKVKVKRGSNL
jgi:N-acetylglutamate synthase-like GNAT family acetyltransferase